MSISLNPEVSNMIILFITDFKFLVFSPSSAGVSFQCLFAMFTFSYISYWFCAVYLYSYWFVILFIFFNKLFPLQISCFSNCLSFCFWHGLGILFFLRFLWSYMSVISFKITVSKDKPSQCQNHLEILNMSFFWNHNPLMTQVVVLGNKYNEVFKETAQQQCWNRYQI